jgi:hypothetical protein
MGQYLHPIAVAASLVHACAQRQLLYVVMGFGTEKRPSNVRRTDLTFMFTALADGGGASSMHVLQSACHWRLPHERLTVISA